MIAIVISIILISAFIPTVYFLTRDWRYFRDMALVKTRYLIEDDQDFTKRYQFSGSGTMNDPFLLANLTIDDRFHYGIVIFKTTKYFSIINCSITVQHTGIMLRSISKGTSEIINNTIKTLGPKSTGRCYSCISLSYSDDCNIESNICSSTQEGICPYGIYSWYSFGTNIKNNTFYNLRTGILLLHSSNHELIGNNFLQNHRGFAGIGLNNIYFTFNNMSNNSRGLFLEVSSHITITKNSFMNNSDSTIVVSSCNSLLIFLNNLSQENYGIYLALTNSSNIYQNNFYHIISDLNRTSMGFDNGEFNFWFNSNSLKGNYWFNFVWDLGAVYHIDGSANNTDSYPLEFPVKF